jgi:hypothetical protein
MRCIVCGGDHQPQASVCNLDGMDREVSRMGAKKWNAITSQVMKANNHDLYKNGDSDALPAEPANTCQKRREPNGWLVCHRCGSIWSDMVSGIGWIRLSCPDRASDPVRGAKRD